MIRYLLGALFGPRCQFGEAIGEGCLRRASYTSHRGLLWCEEHKTETARVWSSRRTGGKR